MSGRYEWIDWVLERANSHSCRLLKVEFDDPDAVVIALGRVGSQRGQQYGCIILRRDALTSRDIVDREVRSCARQLYATSELDKDVPVLQVGTLRDGHRIVLIDFESWTYHDDSRRPSVALTRLPDRVASYIGDDGLFIIETPPRVDESAEQSANPPQGTNADG